MKLTSILAFVSVSSLWEPCNLNNAPLNDLQNEIVLQPGPEEANCGYVSYLETDHRWAEGTNYNKPLTHMEMPSCAWVTEGLTISRSYFSFNFENLPKHRKIKSAKLSLFGLEASNTIVQGNQGENNTIIQRVLGDWRQETLTWNNQPLTTKDGQIEISASTSVWTNDCLDIDVTELINAMIHQTPGQTAGFCLRLKEEKPYRSMLFASSKHPIHEKRPKLAIIYEECLGEEYYVLK